MDVRHLIRILHDRQDKGLITAQQSNDFLMAWDAVQNAQLMQQLAEEKARNWVKKAFASFETPHEGIDFSSLYQLEFDLLKMLYTEKIHEIKDE
jgi:hypothetical protein